MIVDPSIVPAAFTDMQALRATFVFLRIHELGYKGLTVYPPGNRERPVLSRPWTPFSSLIRTRSAWLNIHTKLTAHRLGDKYFFRFHDAVC